MRTVKAVIAAVCVPAALASATVINDDFEVDSSASYVIVNDGTPNGTQTFAFDYVAAGIPLAPRSAPGGGKGLRLTANDSAAAVDAWTLFHNTPVSAPHYQLKVDVWMNFAVASASTEYAQVGVGGNGTTFNSVFTPISGSGAFIAFTGDGGSASDYRWFRDPANSTDPGDTANTTLPNTHPSYLGNGSNNTNAFFQNLFPLAPRVAPSVAGSPGNQWTTLTIDVNNSTNVISFYFNNPLAAVPTDVLTFQGNFTNALNGLVSLGINDTFTSVDAGSVFTLYDNLAVTVIPEPATLGLLAGAGLMALRRRA